ncbi:hypothetical protein RD792_017925 [Penstemon davidsonii]|uniref:Pentatricopeptide repeat-containing protein n=1 Tax=Penstemon davidsonii TaxID=160366 RepID=A0ABR0DX27_9LAMI|nr:hypothetical protein RD792_017925 [Penstemon davidsonii]
MMLNRNRRVATGVLGLIRRRFTMEAKAKAKAAPKPEDRLYRRLSALGRNKGTVESTINEYIEEGKVVNKFELLSCIRQLRKYKKPDHALQIMEWMEAKNVNFGYADHALRIELTAKVHGIDKAENYCNSLPPSGKNKCTYGALLFCYCEVNMTDKALDIFAKMDKMNLLSCLPFNNLMASYMKTRQPEKVPPLMEDMKKRNIQPNTYAYNLLMHSYSCLNDIEGVERVFEEMKRGNKKHCDWTTYSNLAILYNRAGLREKAELALKKLENEMGSDNREAYHFLISLYAGISDLQNVHRIWKSMKSNIKETINKSYLVMLQALRSLNDIPGLKKCYEEWESGCSCFDIRLAKTVIGAYLTHGKINEAELIFQKALDRSQGLPFLKTCVMFMAFFLKNHQIKQALEYMEVAVSRVGNEEWKPKKDVVNEFLDYFKEHGDTSGAEEFYKLMKRMNCVDGSVYKSLIRTYVAAGQTLPDIRARIEEDGIQISSELERLIMIVTHKDEPLAIVTRLG